MRRASAREPRIKRICAAYALFAGQRITGIATYWELDPFGLVHGLRSRRQEANRPAQREDTGIGKNWHFSNVLQGSTISRRIDSPPKLLRFSNSCAETIALNWSFHKKEPAPAVPVRAR